jgi:hypothetical protein
MAISDTAIASTNIMVIAVNMRGAAEGFLPSALMLLLPQITNTQHGPNIPIVKISSKARFLSILAYSSIIIVALLLSTLTIPRLIVSS